MTSYSYPKLSSYDYGWFRISGPGLDNCMFFAAKAYIYAKLHNATFIDPTWNKFSIGPYIRKEKDKRRYNSLFNHIGIHGFKKFLIIKGIGVNKSKIKAFSSLGNYFEDLDNYHDLINDLFAKITKAETVSLVQENELKNKVAIHVRLGDYLPQLRVSIEWYKGIVESILRIKPKQEFVLFSDGNDNELHDLLQINNVKRVYYGNAFADIYAMSKCKMVIASDSTFSAWGAFLGEKPIIFSKRHFPPLYGKSQILEAVVNNSTDLPSEFTQLFD